MKEQLKNRLRVYVAENNPEILLRLAEGNSFNAYITDQVELVSALVAQLQADGQPSYIIEERCMLELTRPLRPSKFNYLKEVLRTEFPREYAALLESGRLRFELVNMLEACVPIFESFDYSEINQHDTKLRHAVIAVISNHLPS